MHRSLQTSTTHSGNPSGPESNYSTDDDPGSVASTYESGSASFLGYSRPPSVDPALYPPPDAVGRHRPRLSKQQKLLAEELDGHKLEIPKLHEQVFNSVKQPLPTDSDISQYFMSSRLFRGKGWVLPVDSESESLKENTLYGPLTDIIDDILIHFGYNSSRSATNTHKSLIPHRSGYGSPDDKEDGTKALQSAPDIMVVGSETKPSEDGDEFYLDPRSQKINDKKSRYLKCVTPIEVKVNRDLSLTKYLKQISVYARGGCYSELINIRHKPHTFVRIVLGVSSQDYEAVGFDTDIFWKGTSDFTTVQMVLPVTTASRGRVGSPPLPETASGVAEHVAGRLMTVVFLSKTTGALKAESRKVIFSKRQAALLMWRRWLRAERGLQLRPSEAVSQAYEAAFHNRIFFRVAFKHGGKSLTKFTSKEQVVYALRDAIKGHRDLWNRKILHRDISFNNILIVTGNPESRGTLIDLDMAVEFPRSDNGTRAFQSINILNSYHSSQRIAEHVPHDYLDDLESFLYVFRWMVEGYSGPGKEVKPRPPHLLEWMHESPALAKACKASSYFLPPCHLVQDYFGEPAQTLVDKYSKFLKDKISAKLHYYAGLDSDSEDDIQSLPDLQEAANQDYAAVIKMFDDAIDEMKQLPDFQDPSKDGTLLVPELPCSLIFPRLKSRKTVQGRAIKRFLYQKRGPYAPSMVLKRRFGPKVAFNGVGKLV
ncbi:hypothetical protein CPC08DRAFT_728627 [Agrocybe pediades]|nr:hypothetical protein CPC08DRAFT_728627 [Agrocybe pediades]